VRTRTHTYVKYETTERELYDLGADPFQLNNIWTTASQSLKNQVGGLLQDLDFCVGAECADAARIDEGNLPPVASFTWSCTNLECSFDGTGSSDPDGTITQWAWDFGDGGTAFGSTTNHTFPAADNYTVQLTVTDDGGATRQKTHTVSVGAGGISRVTNIAIQVKVAKGNVIAKPLVVDGTGARVAGAEVTGTWTRNGAPEGTFVMSTNAQGRAKFVFFPANPQSGQVFEFCVTDVTHPDLAFQPEADDCGSIAWP